MPRKGNRSEAAKKRWRKTVDLQPMTLPSGTPARTGNVGNSAPSPPVKKVSEPDEKSDPNKMSLYQLFNLELAPVDFDEDSLNNDSAEEKSTKSSLPSPGRECNPEVKEGFLFHSKADEVNDRAKEKMDVNGTRDKKKDGEVIQSSKTANGPGNSSPTSKKRPFWPEGEKDRTIDVEVKDGKRARVESVELELKITSSASSRGKLEKVVQQLVENRLQVLQLTLFDRTLMELKERVDKIDTATKQQNALQHISTLQAKISQLTKKFGAANQASEYSKRQNIKCLQPAAKAIATPQTTPRIQRTALDPKQPSAAAISSTATPTEPKPLSSLATASSSALAAPSPILQILSTTSDSTPTTTDSTPTTTDSTPSSTTPLTGQAGTLQLQTRLNTGTMMTSIATSGSQSRSIQPLLLQPGSTAVGIDLISVSSLATVNNLYKAKSISATTNIEQKSARNVVLSTSPSSSSTAAKMSSGKSIYQGGTGMVSSPSADVSVPKAHVPTQCASVVGVFTAPSPRARTGPVATRSAAAGVSSATEKASQTDYQAFNSTPARSLSGSSRPKSLFVDLTEDNDDVQVICVQKATAPSIPTSSQRPSEPPPPLISSTSTVGLFARQRRPSGVSPSKAHPGSSYSGPLPPLPLAPTPPARLPPEAAHTSLPQQPLLELAQVQRQNGIILSWCFPKTDGKCAAVDSYHLYSYHQDHQGSAAASSQSLWIKIGVLKALPLPMACTLTQFVSTSTYYFAVRAKDVFGRFGPFCEPQSTDILNCPSAGSSGAG